MFVYRICCAPHSALDGEGARLFGGRWNSPGLPAIYTSSHLSLAALELLVHLNFDNLPADLVWLKIEVPETDSMETFPASSAPSEKESFRFGDAWLSSGRSLALVVPSAVISVERNLILNPRHPQMSLVKTVELAPFQFDKRLFGS